MVCFEGLGMVVVLGLFCGVDFYVRVSEYYCALVSFVANRV